MLSTNRKPWLKNDMNLYCYARELKYYKYQHSKIANIPEGKEREGKIVEVLIFSFFTEKNHSMLLKTILENRLILFESFKNFSLEGDLFYLHICY